MKQVPRKEHRPRAASVQSNLHSLSESLICETLSVDLNQHFHINMRESIEAHEQYVNGQVAFDHETCTTEPAVKRHSRFVAFPEEVRTRAVVLKAIGRSSIRINVRKPSVDSVDFIRRQHNESDQIEIIKRVCILIGSLRERSDDKRRFHLPDGYTLRSLHRASFSGKRDVTNKRRS